MAETVDDPGSLIERALTAFPEDDDRHWLVQAYLFNLLAHKAQTRADQIRRRTKSGGQP